MPRNSNVHGSKGAFVAGDWVNIEDCADKFNIKNGSQNRCNKNCATCPRSRSRNTSARSDGSYDIAIIGAGCIGSAIARELSKTTASVILLEAADDVTQGATKGNSGIVHAGYDDKPGTVKARYCWPGNQMFPKLDSELHFGFQKNGSLVVAKGAEDEAILEELMERADKNGVKNCRIISKEELMEKEPYIHPDATAALYSPDAGTITPYEYAIALAENAVDNGVEIRIRREVVDIQIDEAGEKKGFTLKVKHWEPEAAAKRIFAPSRGLQFYGLVAAVAAVLSRGISLYVVEQNIDILGKDFGSTGVQAALAAGIMLLLTVLDKIGFRGSSTNEGWSYSPSKGTDLGGLAETETVRADFIVNAAGCKSDHIAKMVGDNTFQVKPRYGEYILLHKDEGYKCQHTLFPTPHPFYGKGVLVQNTLWGYVTVLFVNFFSL